MRALIVVLAAIALSAALRPAPPIRPSAVDGQPTLWRGAYHVHSTCSDGSAPAADIARAAARAGLDFVILTDHGDGTRTPEPPRYVENVLLIDGVEISTDDGHLVALNLPQSPYPLAGEGRAVVDDVRRLGGMAVLAHPDSPRVDLAWHDASVQADGFEWINADSTWRGVGAGLLLAQVVTYPWRPAAALARLASYPAALFASHDVPTQRLQLALAAVDAHARIGWRREADPIEGGRTLARFPSYTASFGTFGLMVPWPAGGPRRDPRRDAAFVMRSLRDHEVVTGVFAMADHAWLAVELVPPAGPAAVRVSGAATLRVRSNAPAGTVIRVVRNGRPWREMAGPTASLPLTAETPPAVYRAQLWLPARRGWPALPMAVSAARGHNLPFADTTGASPRLDTGDRSERAAPLARAWHAEHDARSTVSITPGSDDAIAATLALAPGPRVSQFAALVGDLADAPPDTTALEMTVTADAPMRLSVQLREPRAGEGLRWRHSTFVDSSARVVRLPVAAFRPIRPATGSAPMGRLHALLLVMDTVNARPGDRRAITVHATRWIAAR